LKPKLAIMR